MAWERDNRAQDSTLSSIDFADEFVPEVPWRYDVTLVTRS
jgi:hypothetical protein